MSIALFLACAAIAFSRSATSHGADSGDFSRQEFSDWFHLLASISWGGALLSISIIFSAAKVADNAEQQHIVSGIADRFYVLFGLFLLYSSLRDFTTPGWMSGPSGHF
jgi:putative copper export protein